MATLSQLYNAYLQDDPNVGEMTYDPFGWNIPQTFADPTTTPPGGGGSSVNTGDGYLPGTNPDPNTVRMPKQYIDYLDKNRHTGKNNLIEKGIGFLKNTAIGQGVGAGVGILQDIMPMNQTAIMNNEMLGQGFAVDNIGRIVRVDQGDPDTAGNIMAGYNVSKMDEETFDDRIARIKKTMGREGYKGNLQKRIDAIEAAREAWRRAKIKTGNVYHAKYKDRPDYRMLDTKYEEEMNDPKMLGDLPVYDPEIDYGEIGTPEYTPGYIRSRGANIDAGHWVGKEQHGHGPITLEDIKEDVTGMYTDDPSGNTPPPPPPPSDEKTGGDIPHYDVQDPSPNDPGPAADDWSNWGMYNRGGLAQRAPRYANGGLIRRPYGKGGIVDLL